MKPIYIASYHQSTFGKLFDVSIPDMIERAVAGACGDIGASPSAIDVGSIGAACSLTLNDQGLIAGLLASVPGLEGKPIEAVENACATGGQAVLSVVQKLQLGMGEVGIAVGFEKMRDKVGKMDGQLVGKVLGYFSHPDEREGKVFVFPHIFAEVMAAYMAEHQVPARELAAIAVTEYRNAHFNPYAQMRNVDLTLDVAEKLEGVNRCIVDGLPLKTYDCSQITDGYAALMLATAEGLARLGLKPSQCVRLAGWGQATDPLKKAGRDVLRPKGAYRAMTTAYTMAGITPDEVNVAELHDCFTVMGAIGTEVIGKAEVGKGARFWADGKADVTATGQGACAINTSGGLIAKGHPIGATGIAMIGWSAWQLLGKVPKELQVANARYAATFNIGGPICASVCTVLSAS